MDADAVFEDRRGVGGDGNLELGGECGGFGEFVGGAEHFPFAADRLVDFDGDGRVLVIAESNFVFEFPCVGVDVFVVGLLALSDDVESVADVDGDVFVLGSVVDAVFADEEDAAVGIFLVDADVAGGERNAEAGFFFILEFVIDHDGIFDGRAGSLRVAVVVVVAIDDEDFLDGDAGAFEETDLLGFLVFDGGAAAERVEMIFGEVFLLELGSGGCFWPASARGVVPHNATRWMRFRSPATSWRRALWKAVPELLVRVTQPSRSAALSSRATVRT